MYIILKKYLILFTEGKIIELIILNLKFLNLSTILVEDLGTDLVEVVVINTVFEEDFGTVLL